MTTDTLHTNEQHIKKIRGMLSAARAAATNNDIRRMGPFVQHEMETLQLAVDQAEESLDELYEFLAVRDALGPVE